MLIPAIDAKLLRHLPLAVAGTGGILLGSIFAYWLATGCPLTRTLTVELIDGMAVHVSRGKTLNDHPTCCSKRASWSVEQDLLFGATTSLCDGMVVARVADIQYGKAITLELRLEGLDQVAIVRPGQPADIEVGQSNYQFVYFGTDRTANRARFEIARR